MGGEMNAAEGKGLVEVTCIRRRERSHRRIL